jgi:ABC-type oligopeptide transport system substrate-binding subunit
MTSPRIAKFVLWSLTAAFALSGCAEVGELQKPVASPYYGKIAPSSNGEFRWANGELPKTFDPALAQSSAEMQAVRAVFDGLTDWDAKTLQPVPALAVKWDSSEDFRTWTFYLRSGAVWSNGKRIVAQDLVRSWLRLKDLGADSPHQQLISNIVGSKLVQNSKLKVQSAVSESGKIEAGTSKTQNQNPKTEELIQNPKSKIQDQTWFGIEALDDATLRVYLSTPDKDFPKLTAHSALRPVFDDGDEFDKPDTASKIITSGAFRLASYDKNGVLLERSKNYWNVSAVKMERIRLTPTKGAESALAAYQAGEVDAVTNAHIEPLALKLLASYTDFKRTTFNAVTFYEFNMVRAPFSDHRVREALTIAIDRNRLTNDELDGATFPAHNFLPDSANTVFAFDVRRAQNLLADAGFPSGKGFPKIKLLVNRNDAAYRLAKAVAAQWQKNLGVGSEIVVSSFDVLENSEATKDFDLIRRVVVLPTTDETANLQAMFKRGENTDSEYDFGEQLLTSAASNSLPAASSTPNGFPIPLPTLEPIEDAPQIKGHRAGNNPNQIVNSDKPAEPNLSGAEAATQFTDQSLNLNEVAFPEERLAPILTETQAFDEIPAIPLFFPSSYALVKPYVKGFETNSLDAPSLKDVEIQTDWQPSQNTIY